MLSSSVKCVGPNPPTDALVGRFSVLFALIFLHVLSDHGTSVLDHHDGRAAHIATSAVGGEQVGVINLDHSGWATAPGLCVIRV